MLDLEDIDFKNCITWDDIEAFVDVCSPSEIDLVSPSGEKEYASSNQELKEKLFEEDYTGIIIPGHTLNINMRKIFFQLKENNPETEIQGIHIYCSYSKKANGFSAHCDRPHNVIAQIDGKTKWQTYDMFGIPGLLDDPDVKIDKEQTLNAGDYIMIPSRMYHKADVIGKRISASIMFY